MNQNPITGAFWVGSKRPDPWRLAFSLSVAIFASPVILDFRLRSWPGSLGDQKHRDAASKLRNGVRTCLYFWDLGDILMHSVMFIYIYTNFVFNSKLHVWFTMPRKRQRFLCCQGFFRSWRKVSRTSRHDANWKALRTRRRPAFSFLFAGDELEVLISIFWVLPLTCNSWRVFHSFVWIK